MDRTPSTTVAVVGMACHFPGATDLDDFWSLLEQGGRSISPLTCDRWNNPALYNARAGTPGKLATQAAGLIDNFDRYDHAFLGLSRVEAQSTDPQQLLALETAWRALEDANIRPSTLAGKRVGVFIGASGNDFEAMQTTRIDSLTAHSGTGTNASIISARIAYALDLRGPAMTINTACSSSLVAIHEACLNIQAGLCESAVAGGVHLMLIPGTTVAVSQAGMMSPQGLCKTFDEGADGYVRAEGCGVVMLKDLRKAQEDGDRIYAVIKGSSVNQDGLTNGLTAPNRRSQEQVILQALERAGATPDDIGYVEAHGTGTRLGDPIEINALKALYGAATEGAPRCYVGSVKANIGHLEPAAGVAGFIKTVLQLHKRTILQQPSSGTLNPLIQLDGSRLAIPRENLGWQQADRLAAVSAFSFGGTNCHLIVGSHAQPAVAAQAETGQNHLLLLSSKSEKALPALIHAYVQALQADAQPSLRDLCATTANGREHFDYRVSVTDASPAGCIRKLQALDLANVGRAAEGVKIAFLFSGQGTQYFSMGHALYQRYAVVRQWIERGSVLIERALGVKAEDILWNDPSLDLNRTAFTQPALYVLEVAIAKLWESFGIVPSVVVGHSIGEYAAACISGAFSYEVGLSLVLARGQCMEALGVDGNMLAVKGTRADIAAICAQRSANLHIAAINTPTDTVVAGLAPDIAALSAHLTAEGFSVFPLKGNRPFHSPHMADAAREFLASARHAEFTVGDIPMLENVSAARVGESGLTADYWAKQITNPVDFLGCIQHADLTDVEVFVEIGPGSTLLGLARAAREGADTLYLPSLSSRDKADETLLNALGKLYCRGGAVDLGPLYGTERRTSVPGHPLLREPILTALDPARWAPALPPQPVHAVQWSPVSSHAPASLWADAPVLVLQGVESPLSPRDKWRVVSFAQWQATGATRMLQADTAPRIVVLPCFLAEQAAHHGDGPGAASLTMAALATVKSVHQASPAALNMTFVLPVQGALQDLAWSAIPGALKSVQLELRNAELKSVFVPAGAQRVHLPEVVELSRVKGSEEYRLDEHGIQALRLLPTTIAPGRQSILPTHAYVISGGTGSIGVSLAQALLEKGAGQVLLLSRKQSDASARSERLVHLLASNKVHLVQADVTDSTGLLDTLRHTQALTLPVDAVFHAAGLTSQVPFEHLTDEDVAQVQASKTHGTLALFDAARVLGAERFISFSSISSLWGAPQLAHYSSANRYLDAFATFAHATGPRLLGINWGPWAGDSMAPAASLVAFERIGIHALEPKAALRCLFELLDAGTSGQFMVCDADWQRLAEQYATRGAAGIFQALQAPLATPAAPALAAVKATETAEPLAVGEFVTQAVATLLNEDVSAIDSSDSLHERGLDSLAAVQLRNQLEKQFELTLPATLVFDFPTIEAITHYITRQIVAVSPVLETSQRKAPMPDDTRIAIVGMGCRLPGDVESLEDFWELLSSGKDAMRPIRERWENAPFALDVKSLPEDVLALKAGLLSGIEGFDHQLFGITATEARYMDPQQRMALELAWRCIESAGYKPSELAGKKVGVYIGVGANEYRSLCLQDPESYPYLSTGNALNAIAGRVAYHFGLKGPAVTIDTACSSSLVAIHQAAQALRNGECHIALAGGVNSLLCPDTFISLARARMLSPHSRCATFDSSADGYVRAEGGAMLLLKRLGEAVAAQEMVHAVIQGSAINQDGRSASLTAPNGASQQEVINEALASAGLTAADVDWIETHGTGTGLGDPIELQALDAVYGAAGKTLTVGAVKSTVGHLEAASGVVGLIKIVCALAHDAIPPNRHFTSLNPNCHGLRSRIQIPTQALKWERQANRERIAAVSSFGFSGTNVHMLIAEGVSPPVGASAAVPAGKALLLLAANSSQALRQQIAALSRLPGEALSDACAESLWLKDPARFRQAVCADTPQALHAALKRLAAQNSHDKVPTSTTAVLLPVALSTSSLQNVRALYAEQALFREALDDYSTKAGFGPGALWQTEPNPGERPALTVVLNAALLKFWAALGVKASLPDSGIGPRVRAFVDGQEVLAQRALSQAAAISPAEDLQAGIASYRAAGKAVLVSGVQADGCVDCLNLAQALPALFMRGFNLKLDILSEARRPRTRYLRYAFDRQPHWPHSAAPKPAGLHNRWPARDHDAEMSLPAEEFHLVLTQQLDELHRHMDVMLSLSKQTL